MRDSRVGTFAVAGAGCVLLVKYGTLLTLLDSKDTGDGTVWPDLLLFHVAARWTITLLLTAFPNGRGRASERLSPPPAGPSRHGVGFAAGTGGQAGIVTLAGASLLTLLLGLALRNKDFAGDAPTAQHPTPNRH